MAVTERAATAERAISPELVMQLRRPLEVSVSPDGSRVAFPVSAAFSRPGERVASAIWVAPTDGAGAPREMTRGHGQDALPRWSPDGTMLAFASDRDHSGRMSLYLLGAGPAEAQPLGEIEGSVEDLAWSPDGSRLLVLAADIGSDRAGVQAATRIEEAGHEEQDPRVRRPLQAWRRLLSLDVPSGETVEVGPEGSTVWEFDWRGGPTAAAIVSDDPTESAWYRARIALLDLSARTASTVYRPEWQVAVPRLSPDSETICFVEGFCSDRGVLAGTVMVADGAGKPRAVPLDTDVSWLAWRDERSLWYSGWRGMGSACGRLALDGSVEELFSGPVTLGTRYQPRVAAGRNGLLAAVLESLDEPPEVAVLDPAAGDGWRTITTLNADVATEIVRPGWEPVSWRGRDGLEIEGLLARPPGPVGEALPLVVLVHGGPTGAWSYQFAPYAGMPLLLAEAGYAVLLPNPRGSAGRGQEFARANLGDMGGEDLQDILAGIDALVEAGTVDGERLAITGGSYGGFMAAWAATQTDRFAASIPMACVSHWLSFHLTTNIGRFDELFLDADPFDPDGEYAARSPVFHARKCKTPTLVIHGEIDLCTPLGQAQELYQALVEAGVETELVFYPREGHGWLEWDHQIDVWTRVRSWLDRHLTGTS